MKRLIIPASHFFLIACNNQQSNTKSESTPANTNNKAIVLAASPPANFKHQTANVNGINIHYVIGGEGEPLVVIHVFGQN